ncbi:MAG: glycosyltransferase family 4 protein [Candidatus Peribacteraceae bacterium]|jgi:glycosyltransferase involved in cell wall biosynthesis|nr:glycosyltransferase family 4 protein [Candidatus Peribacteraceae bacterium]
MRVCVLTTVLDVFKGGNHLPLFAALPDVQFTVVTGRILPEGAALPANVRVIDLKLKLGSYYFGFADWRFARAVLRTYPVSHPFWKEFDILHLNQVLGSQFAVLRKAGVPVLYAIHHPVTADREVAIAETSSCERILWRLKYFFLVHRQRRLCHSLPHVMTVSHTVRDRLVRECGIPSEKISVVPNGVDGERFGFAGDQTPDFDVVAVGSFLHPRKGFRYLLETYSALAKEGIRIADVGKRSHEQRAMLRGIPGLTAFETVSDVKIVSIIQRSATLLSTSLYEGFGLSLIEALACGRPAFAFDAGAVKEVLSPIDPSLVVPLRDSAALVRRVREFLAFAPEERLKRGNRYREEVLQRYSLRASADALRAVYERLCSRGSPVVSEVEP